VLTTRTDLRAARTGVPGSVGPFDIRVFAHNDFRSDPISCSPAQLQQSGRQKTHHCRIISHYSLFVLPDVQDGTGGALFRQGTNLRESNLDPCPSSTQEPTAVTHQAMFGGGWTQRKEARCTEEISPGIHQNLQAKSASSNTIPLPTSMLLRVQAPCEDPHSADSPNYFQNCWRTRKNFVKAA